MPKLEYPEQHNSTERLLCPNRIEMSIASELDALHIQYTNDNLWLILIKQFDHKTH